MMDYIECMHKRLLRSERPDLKKSDRSMDIAEAKLSDASDSFEHGIYSGAIVFSYTSMFHAARAVLFRDGYVEKSHACLAAYLRENYVKKGKLSQKYAGILKDARFERHEALYGLETKPSKVEAEELLESAKEFLEEIRRLLSDEKEGR